MRNDKHISQNLYECSFLLAKGFKLVTHQSNGHKSSLVFENTPDLQSAVMDYYNGQGVVPPKVLFDSYRSLKDMVFQR